MHLPYIMSSAQLAHTKRMGWRSTGIQLRVFCALLKLGKIVFETGLPIRAGKQELTCTSLTVGADDLSQADHIFMDHAAQNLDLTDGCMAQRVRARSGSGWERMGCEL